VIYWRDEGESKLQEKGNPTQMKDDIISISPDDVVGACARKKAEGYRFVTMTCTAMGNDKLDILYHFEKDLALVHLRLNISKDLPLPSISAVYFAAFLVENEIQDLFGVKFHGLALDYQNTLYLDPEVGHAPFCTVEIEGVADNKLSKQGQKP
jgi:NADH:ubiquinone oxidoreductase subunit C